MYSEIKEFEKLYNLILEERAEKVDAIVWLQGDRYDRAAKILGLYRGAWSKKIIISGNDILIGKRKRPGENNISLDKMKWFLLKNSVSHKSLIIDDGAMNTREQAEHILKMAKDKKWRSLILVGSSYYQPRAFLTFLKQVEKIKWRGKIINQPKIIAWNKKPSGRENTSKFLFNQEFKKIEKYKKDLVSIKQGVKYFEK